MSAIWNQENLPRPLEGFRVVECGIWHAGPEGSAILGDLGAEVIKIESLDGDPERNFGTLPGAVSFSGSDKKDWSILYAPLRRVSCVAAAGADLPCQRAGPA